MKKFTTLLCTLLAAAGLTGASASAWTVKVNIDDASHVTCVDEDYEPVALVTGENVFNGDSWSTYYFTVVEPYEFKSIVDDSTGYSEYFYNGKWTGTFSSDGSYTITTYNAEEARTATASITVTDDVTNVVAYRDGGLPLDLTAGTPTSFKFNPQTENVFYIKPKENGTAIYKVTVDGQDKTADSYGEYSVYIEDGSEIIVQSKFPDLPATLTFSYNNGGEGCISNVKLNNQLVEDFDGKTLAARLGDKISFEKTKNWDISSFTINDARGYLYYDYSGVVTGDMAFNFIAQYDDPNVTVKLDIDDASHVKVKLAYSSPAEYFDIVSGENVLKVERYNSIEVEPVEPYAIDEVIDLTTNLPMSVTSSSWTQYISSSGEYNYKITTYDQDAARTASFTVNVDDASKVLFRRQSDYKSIPLENGSNTVRFNPTKETEYVVMPSGSNLLYEVKLNGDKQTASYGSYNLTLSNGNTVDITAIIPDIPVTVDFTYVGEDIEECISSVKVDGETVSDFDGKSMTIKMGQKVTISFNSIYSIDGLKVNGEAAYYYGYGDYTSSNLMENTTFEVTAHKLGTIKATVKVDDPTNLIFATGSYSTEATGSTIVALKAGDNEIELPENNRQICWKAANGCFIESVDVNGTKMSEYTFSTSVNEGDVVTFVTGKIVYDMSAIVWIDNKEAASNFFDLQGEYPESTKCEVATGYNEIAFRQSMLPLNLSWYGAEATVGKVYVNDALQQPAYSGSTSYKLDIKTGDVVKIFLSTEPVTNTVTFDIEEGLEVSATTDRVTPVEDLTAPLKVYGGTEVALTVNSDEQLVVMNGETAMTPDEDGKYVATVSADTKIGVKKFVKGDFSVALNETEITLVEEETKTLTATFTKGDDVTVAQQGFTSSDEAVATVSAGGLVTAVAKGEATITFTATDNYERTVTATCKVTVTEKSGIFEIEANGAEGVIFDLQGRRVNKAAKGFYIINGQKVIR